MIDIKPAVKALVETLQAENLNYRVLVFTDKNVIDSFDMTVNQYSSAVTHDVWQLSKKTGKTVDEVLHDIAFTIKVFDEEFEAEFEAKKNENRRKRT